MNAYYSEVPQRLCAYRKALEKTQKEMAEKFGVKQDHYSRLESGKTFLSYRNLICFVSNGGDIYYLITGKEQYTGVIDAYLDKFKILRDKVELLKLILWVTYQGVSYEESNKIYEIKRAWKHIELIENEKKINSIWKNIRKVEGISQKSVYVDVRFDFYLYYCGIWRKYKKLSGCQSDLCGSFIRGTISRFFDSYVVAFGIFERFFKCNFYKLNSI